MARRVELSEDQAFKDRVFDEVEKVAKERGLHVDRDSRTIKLAEDIVANGGTVEQNADGSTSLKIPLAGKRTARPKSERKAGVTDDKLRLFVERIERQEEEKKGIADDIRDTYQEAKSVGYDTKAIRAVVKLRKLRKDERENQEAVLDTYKAALGLG